ncbi:MAG: DNA-directed RNA polymerase subunit beta' [Dehalococcoidia bacterium]|nr:DNA-directed RNA polymerase subunit beta' [Dehalococcoidia bacterium]
MSQFDGINGIRISLASSEQIRSWSHGEVTKAETINYRTLKPERDGLFCEKIFGPVKDFECHCGKYKKARYKGVICDKCGVEVAHSGVRRERTGHIELAAPVTHIWFAKLVPSRLGLLLDLSPRDLEGVIYFARYIIISVDEEAKEKKLRQLQEEIAGKTADHEERLNKKVEELEAKELEEEVKVKEVNQLHAAFVERKASLQEELKAGTEEIEGLKPLRLLHEEECRRLKDKYGEVFETGMGAEALLQVLKQLDLDALHQKLLEQIRSTSGGYRKRVSQRLQLVEGFKLSANKPEWMVLTVLPVLPPSLRPIVQLDGGRFVISDLNDLYRRVINRNNRLRRLIKLGAPEIIIRNEKRMLQEAVDALIDNGRRGRAVTTGNKHPLKSLSDILKGKQGRFRQNLLGKRVDYSGRSVIVVGPKLKLHQCGLPRHVALELLKPSVMHKLIQNGYANNLKSARRLVERGTPEVWDALYEVVKERPVLLNRAPTLHRLSIQAFEPVLIDGDAFQLHPLVCTAFGADFDGDQMAVHVPLSRAAVKEAREHMLSPNNMLLPSSGEPSTTPTLDMVLGCYYLTLAKPGAKGEGKLFSSFEEARLAYELGVIELGAEIVVQDPSLGSDGGRISTTVGRILFNDALPPQLRFRNQTTDKAFLRALVSDCISVLGNQGTAGVLDKLKQAGFEYATKSGVSVSMDDIEEPPEKRRVLEEAEERMRLIEDQFDHGLITEDEKYESSIQVWMEATDKVTESISRTLDPYGSIYMMATSGAKGNISQIRQMAGMRGLMTDPSGRIIDFPIKSSLRDGLAPMEYFISTHGGRKGLTDTALRTSDSGYLTRRLVDVAQDVIVTQVDCGTTEGVWIARQTADSSLPPFERRVIGYLAASQVVDPAAGDVIVDRDEELNEAKVQRIVEAGVEGVHVRSPLTCRSRFGVCRNCYGRDLGKKQLVKLGTAVGVVAAQSIGEPGTQLTLQTFHTGGIVGLDITTGLPRVEELFEARTPSGSAVISEIDGTIEITHTDGESVVKVTSSDFYMDEYPIPPGAELAVSDGQLVAAGSILFSVPEQTEGSLPAVSGGDGDQPQPLVARVAGQVIADDDHVCIRYEESEEREYTVPHGAHLLVQSGDQVKAGDRLTRGPVDPHDILRIMGKAAVQQYLIDEVQKVYRAQGVTIHDKHIAVITRRMLSNVRIISSGDTKLLPGELVDRFDYEEMNARVLAEGGEPATAQAAFLGITRASLSKDSWLSAASFQETGRVLVDAAIKGKLDRLRGLKENVILGKLIPSRILAESPEDGTRLMVAAGDDEGQTETPEIEHSSRDLISEG